jgi:hypothetical protein
MPVYEGVAGVGLAAYANLLDDLRRYVEMRRVVTIIGGAVRFLWRVLGLCG